MKHRRQHGFAMVLVLVLVAVAVILGTSYLSLAALHTTVSHNYQSLSQARYLAESGLEHAMYVLRFTPSEFDDGRAGPYAVANGSYTLYCTPDPQVQGRYTLSAAAQQGGVTRTSSVVVYRPLAAETKLAQGLLIGGGGWVTPPWGLTLQGDCHVSGWLFNSAVITGNVSATMQVWDSWLRIQGMISPSADDVALPPLVAARYRDYTLGGVTYSAIQRDDKTINSNDPICRNKGGAISASNVAGVVYLTPRGSDTVTLSKNVRITGTLVVNGHLELDGQNIEIESVDGFPAIITTGSVKITDEARSVQINGVVSAAQGLVASGGSSKSSVAFNGGVVCATRGFSSSLAGAYTVTYDARRARLFDLTQAVGVPPIQVVRWND